MKRGPTVPPAGRRGGGPWGYLRGHWGVRILVVHGYGTVERPVRPRQSLSYQIGASMEPRFRRYGPMGPNEP